MEGKMKNVFIVLLLAGVLLFSCGDSEKVAEGPTIIRFGHNWSREVDPSWKDPVTGDTHMGLQEREARAYAEQQVLEKLNVKIEWVDYDNQDTSLLLLRAVLAGDPLADIVRIITRREGVHLGQNVVQPLDEFADIFADEDSSWMFLGKIYGHNYFLMDRMRNGSDEPLLFNIGMLNRVPALKENGKTVLPVDLWLEGKWTWSVFEDYLQKIHDFYQDQEGDIIAYGGNHVYASLMAIHSNGASAFGDRGLEFNSPRAKEAIAYIERLMSKKLLRNKDIIPGTGLIGWDLWRFRDGETVFQNLAQWVGNAMAGPFNDRGDTMGVVPFPRPDRMAPDDPEYRQLNEAKDSWIIPRGVSRDKVELTLRAFREYILSYYKKLANSDRALDYLEKDESLRFSAMNLFLDVTNTEYGDKILDAWRYLGSTPHINEFLYNTGLWQVWVEQILGDSLYKINGASSYATYVEANMPIVYERMNSIQQALNSAGIVDNIPPVFTDIDGIGMLFPVGTTADEINWNQFLQVSDNVDGAIDFSNVAVDIPGVDFAVPGRYENAVSFSVRDASGNEGTAGRTVVVFDAVNTIPPTLVIRSNLRAVKLNEDTAGINWMADFVESATDKDGIDIRDSLFVDLSELNTTVTGSYPVTLFVRDYAGNETSAEITVNVE